MRNFVPAGTEHKMEFTVIGGIQVEKAVILAIIILAVNTMATSLTAVRSNEKDVFVHDVMGIGFGQ